MDPKLIPMPRSIRLDAGFAYPDLIPTELLDSSLAEEAYRLSILPDAITITGGSDQAIVWGESTLAQLRCQYPEALPCLDISDAPAYGFRSFHIDCARHFFPMDTLRQMASAASLFKLNKLHWHISDDQGWRIESERYPLLHQVGSRRKGDHFGLHRIDAEEGGYYTKAEVREFVRHCADLGIEVIPEVDIPGHVNAILAAYPHLSCTGEPMEVYIKNGITSELLCVGQEDVFAFLETLFDELMELFPGKYFHIGGDEAPKTRWTQCPHCQKRLEETGLATWRQLQGYMMNRIASFLKSRGRTAIVWNDGAFGGNLTPDAVIQVWFGDQDNVLARHTAQGGKLMLSPTTNCYFDYPYGRTPLKKAYELNMEPAEFPADSILGNEGLLWTEFVRTPEELGHLHWPRLAATAEIGWNGQTRRDYENFEESLHALIPMLKELGVAYAPESAWNPDPEEAEAQRAHFSRLVTANEITSYQELLQQM